jgi:3-oxoacyl-[acyl-carrier-protein] synthase II
VRDVIVAGLGVVSPAGSDEDTFWGNLLSGQSFVRPISRFDASAFPVQIAAEISDFDPADYLTRVELRRSSLPLQYAVGAADQAIADAGGPAALGPSSGVFVGTCFGGIVVASEQLEILRVRGPRKVDPFFAAATIPNAIGGFLATRYGVRGPNLCLSTGCAAGTHAIGAAFRSISTGQCDAALALGTEAMIVPLAVAGFWRIGALCERFDSPDRASRPFDTKRAGFVLGEGAGCLLLEAAESVAARGGSARARIAGFAEGCEAFHPTSPREDGSGAAEVMQAALRDAHRVAADIVHVNSHGTATEHNDLAEGRAVGALFGPAVPVTSTKGAIGHAIGAAGAIEAVASVLALETGISPPTANIETLDPRLDILVSASPLPLGKGSVISNSFAIGGQMASLVLEPVA